MVIAVVKDVSTHMFRGTAGVVSRLSPCADGIETHTELQILFRETRARCMGLTVNQWLDEFDSHTRSQTLEMR